MQEYIYADDHADRPLDQLADVMAQFQTHANCQQLTVILAHRLAAVEAAQDFTANRLGEQESHEHLEVENRLAAVEAVQKPQDTGTVPVVERDIRKVVTSLQVLLLAVEDKLQRLDFFAADLNTNLDDALARIIVLEKAR